MIVGISISMCSLVKREVRRERRAQLPAHVEERAEPGRHGAVRRPTNHLKCSE